MPQVLGASKVTVMATFGEVGGFFIAALCDLNKMSDYKR